MSSDMEAIAVRELTKVYRMGVGRARVREMLPWPFDRVVPAIFPKWWSRHTFNALDNVSFSAPAGSSLAVIGHNGAGKTTLLRLIAGITSPSRGSVKAAGRVAALIDVLVGFHPELTGRENIYLLGAVYGFSRQEMKTRLDRILDFAEIDELADTPLKRYSAGMGARLGFGTLTALDPEVVLLDEVLAVGDSAFQRRCMGWLEEYRVRGGTLVFVSHNLAMVRSMTERAIWLDHGKLVSDGRTHEVVAAYAKAMERRSADPQGPVTKQARKQLKSRGTHRWGAGGAYVEEVHLDEDRLLDEGLKVSIAYEASEVSEAVFCLGFLDDSGRDVAAVASAPVRLRTTGGSVQCVIHPLPLRSGIYFPVVAILSPDGRVRDRWRLDRAIVVDGNGQSDLAGEFGPVELAGNWSHADS
jgi:ABC-type polysaccharide/polyol phosphate transport system ATPase subunit